MIAAMTLVVELRDFMRFDRPRVSRIIATRHDHLPEPLTDIAWAAQLRLHGKFKRLVARRALKNKAVVTVARELAGFVSAIGREVQHSGWQGIQRSQPIDTSA